MIDCARLRRPALRVLSFRRRGLDASGGLVRRRGRLRFHGTPEALMADANGHVWSWTVPSERLAEVRAGHRISRAQRRTDGVEVRVVGERLPSADAMPVAPDLEDAYLWRLHRTELAA